MKTLITPRSGNRHDLRKLADQLETIADALHPCDANFARHARIMARVENLRRIANRLN